jgi:cytoskeletal protein CcmA (bactofilin family)
MSIFRRETPSASPAGSGGPSEPRRTLVAPGTRLRGEVGGTTEVLVEGEVVGEVRVDAPVIVGADGVIEGPVTAPVVRVGGRVIGDVQASDRVEVLATGSVEGNISAPRVVISEGAFFKGRVEMTGAAGTAEKTEART